MDKLFSIIIPVYNEEEKLKEHINKIIDILSIESHKFEFILVDDGSRDNSWAVIEDLVSNNKNISGISFSRNFGKEAAIFAGFDVFNGDACIVMDSDLQHPPKLIHKMIELWEKNSCDIVEGVKTKRHKARIINKVGAYFFNKLMNRLTGLEFKGASDFKLLDKKVIDFFLGLSERNTFYRGLAIWTGFKKCSVPFEVIKRDGGSSKWSYIKLFKLAINAITSFSSVPLHIVTALGIIFLFSSIALGAHTLYQKLIGMSSDGFTTVILLLLLIGSVIMISLGLIGTYIARIYDEVKKRPRYIINKKI